MMEINSCEPEMKINSYEPELLDVTLNKVSEILIFERKHCGGRDSRTIVVWTEDGSRVKLELEGNVKVTMC